ncbi:hypothetical protein [Tenacibaculum sp. nBUS_03]|uniref:hypothetical protein n=1 Tax=Tenacibaculum sp. nBUS_03 TaxID=3395320 RepID=UPI003EBA8403
MSIEKNKIFNIIRKKLPPNVLFTEEIADVLDISYDASYRRIKGKTSLALEEALILAKHFKVSLNELYGLQSENSLFIDKKSYDNTIDGLVQFYKEYSYHTESFTKSQETSIIYSAKDIPLYHFKTDNLYWKFRIYVHLNFLYSDADNKIEFKNFKPCTSIFEKVNKFRSNFLKANITDIWEDTTINSSLYQIFYFFKIKLIEKEEALLLCDEITCMIQEIEKSATQGFLNPNKEKKFNLYYSKLLNLNHTIFFKTKGRKSVLIPYSSLSHMKIENESISNEIDIHLKKQMQFAKKISGDSGEVDRKIFVTTMYEKIAQLKSEIESKVLMSFI